LGASGFEIPDLHGLPVLVKRSELGGFSIGSAEVVERIAAIVPISDMGNAEHHVASGIGDRNVS
jgi:hypothetical protein